MIRYLEPTQPVGQQAVQAAEATLGVRLPQQYRAYLLNHANGGQIESAGLPGFADVSVNNIFGVGRDDTHDLVRFCGYLAPLVGLGFLPAGLSAGGNPVCISMRHQDPGTVWFNDHELHFDDPDAFVKLSDSWDDFVDAARPYTPELPSDARVISVMVSPGLEDLLRNQRPS